MAKSKALKVNQAINESTKIIVDVWNQLSRSKKCSKKANTLGIIQRQSSNIKTEDVIKAIERYKELLHDDNYFFDYEWSLQSFTTSRVIDKFLDGGQLWSAYVDNKSPNHKKEEVKLKIVDVPNYEAMIEYFKKMKYTDYLLTSHWKHFSSEARKHYANKCVLCDSTDKLHIHHKIYKNIGRETFNDVVCLCSKCHRMVHDKNV